jgi:hypothetical protein
LFKLSMRESNHVPGRSSMADARGYGRPGQGGRDFSIELLFRCAGRKNGPNDPTV